MQATPYPYHVVQPQVQFHFMSMGVQGQVERVISFQELRMASHCYYQLETRTLQGIDGACALTGNGDKKRMLLTIACIILHYLQQYPHRYVFLMGHTEARTRLYQQSLLPLLQGAAAAPLVFGFNGLQWESFQPKQYYHAFIITHATHRHPYEG